jgi:tetratricopeptide (TPR) repeat protein
MANTLRVTGRFDESSEICRNVMKTVAARKPENADVLSTAYVVLGLCNLDRGTKNYAETEKAFLKGLRIFEGLVAREKTSGHRVENDIWRARIFNNLGLLAEAQGRHEQAIRYYLRSCKLKQKHFEEYGLAQTTSNLAKTYLATGEFRLASDCLKNVLTWMQKIPDAYICEDAIFEILQALQSQGLLKMKSNAAASASHYSAKWWSHQIKLTSRKVREIVRTLYQLRMILSTLTP